MSNAAVKGLLGVLFTIGFASFLLAGYPDTGAEGSRGKDALEANPERFDESSLGQSAVVLLQTSIAKASQKLTGKGLGECGAPRKDDTYVNSLLQGTLLDMVSVLTRLTLQSLVPDVIALLIAAMGFVLFRWTLRRTRAKATLTKLASEKLAVSKMHTEELPPTVVVQARPKKRWAILEETDAFGCTPLHVASHQGKQTEVRRLLELGSFVDAREAWDETPLHFSAREGHVEVCRVLIGHGASINAVNADDRTPLFVAAVGSQQATCDLLLDAGAGVAGARDDQLPNFLTALLLQRIAAGEKVDASDSDEKHLHQVAVGTRERD